MLTPLKFVQGALARTSYNPELSCFRIAQGSIRAFNGGIGLCSPIETDLDAMPDGRRFTAAITACEETIALKVDAAGNLTVSSGDFSTVVPCSADKQFPNVFPRGERIRLTKPIVAIVKTLLPFVGDDGARPWSTGILFNGPSAFATNGKTVVQYWIGLSLSPLPILIHSDACHELVRIGEEPEFVQVDADRLFFHFSGNRWLSTQQLTGKWPDVEAMIEKAGEIKAKHFQPTPEFWKALRKLEPFANEYGQVFFHGDRMATNSENTEAGTFVKLPGLPRRGAWSIKQLLQLERMADWIGFDSYPSPCIVLGGDVRGLIVGMRE